MILRQLIIFFLSIFFLKQTFADSKNVKYVLSELIQTINIYGPPHIEGEEIISDKKIAPTLYFGTKKINNSFFVVDLIKKKQGGTATIFVKNKNEFTRISTNVLKNDGNRAIGTDLAKNKAFEEINKGHSFCGLIEILSKMYNTCYEPIKNNANEIIGIYYVGFLSE